MMVETLSSLVDTISWEFSSEVASDGRTTSPSEAEEILQSWVLFWVILWGVLCKRMVFLVVVEVNGREELWVLTEL